MSSNEPTRIQLKRTKGWRKPVGAIVVSRPSRWGNPYKAQWSDCSMGSMCWKLIWTLTSEVVEDHFNDERAAHTAAVANYMSYINYEQYIPGIRAELAGHDLACWCALDQPCHADVLLEIANPGLPTYHERTHTK